MLSRRAGVPNQQVGRRRGTRAALSVGEDRENRTLMVHAVGAKAATAAVLWSARNHTKGFNHTSFDTTRCQLPITVYRGTTTSLPHCTVALPIPLHLYQSCHSLPPLPRLNPRVRQLVSHELTLLIPPDRCRGEEHDPVPLLDACLLCRHEKVVAIMLEIRYMLCRLPEKIVNQSLDLFRAQRTRSRRRSPSRAT